MAEPTATEGWRRRNLWIVRLLLVVLVAGVFWPVVTFGFIDYDDNICVFENKTVRSGLNPTSIHWAFTTLTFANWMPLTWLSFMLDATVYGPENPGGFHLTNVILHALAVVCLFEAVRRATGQHLLSFLLAALFAVHPQHVQSVAWIAERKGLLSTLFGVLALWAYVVYVGNPARRRWWWAMWFATLLSLMSKQMWVTLPALLLLWDLWPLERWSFATWRSRLPRLILEKWSLFALVLIFAGIAFYAQRHGGALPSLEEVSLENRLANILVSTMMYVVKFFVPTHFALVYPLQVYETKVIVWSFVGLVLLSAGSIVALLRGRPALFVGWWWFLIALLPVSGIVQIGAHARADRYADVPSIGLMMALLWGVPSLVPKSRAFQRAAYGVLVLFVMACVPLSGFELGFWKNNRLLADRMIEVTGPMNSTAHFLLALEHYKDGNYYKTIDAMRTVESIGIPNERIQNSVLFWYARAYQELKEYGMARDYWIESVARQPDDRELMYFLHSCAVELMPAEESRRYMLERLKEKRSPDLLFILAALEERMGNRPAARAMAEEAIALQPGHFEATAFLKFLDERDKEASTPPTSSPTPAAEP